MKKKYNRIVLFAKNEYIQELMIKEKYIDKEYIAITDGILEKKEDITNIKVKDNE